MTLHELLGALTSQFKGVSLANAIGINPDVDIVSTPEAVIAPGGSYTFLTSAQSLEVVSDSLQDAAAGTGARSVRLDLLDANYLPVSVTVNLNGTTPVAVTGTYIRGNDMRITGTVGSGETNAGNITLRVAGGGTVVSYMLAGKGRSQQAIYTVPAGRTAFAFHTKLGIIRARQSVDAEVELRGRAFGSNTVPVSASGNVSDISDPPFPPPFFEKTDIQFVVTAVSANDTAIHAVLQMLLVEDTYRVPSLSIVRELRAR